MRFRETAKRTKLRRKEEPACPAGPDSQKFGAPCAGACSPSTRSSIPRCSTRDGARWRRSAASPPRPSGCGCAGFAKLGLDLACEGANVGLVGLVVAADAGAAGVPGDRRRGLAEAHRFRRHLPRPLRRRDRPARHQARRIRAVRRIAGAISSRRCWRPRTGASSTISASTSIGTLRARDRQRACRRRRPGRLLDHPAARQERVPHQRALDLAQDHRGLSGAVARASPDQEGDPRASISTAPIWAAAPSASRRRRATISASPRATSISPKRAMLAGLFKAPTKFSPNVNLPAARARANDVLSNLVDAGFMTEAQVYSARRNPATPVERTEHDSPDWYLDFAFDEIKQLAAAGQARRRPRADGAHRARPGHPAEGRRGAGGQAARRRAGLSRPSGRRRHRRSRRPRARHRRRPRLWREPVQPRHRRAAPARLLVQGDRLSRRRC